MAAKKTQVKRPARRTLFTIGLLLILSAGLRVGQTAGAAFALQPSEPLVETEATCAPVTTVPALLEALQEREKRVAEQEEKIAARMKEMAAADGNIRKQLEELERAEAALRRTVDYVDGAAEGDLTQLTSVYENMKPKAAAALFEAMDPEFAAGFLARMAPQAAAEVLAGLSADRAYEVSSILAGRNAKSPKR